MGYVRRTYNPYRSTRRTYAPNRSAYQKRTATGKRKSAAKARAVKTVPQRKRAIKRNTNAIRSLRAQLYGPIQKSTSMTNSIFHIHRDHPALFCVTTPDHGHTKGPRVMSIDPVTGALMSLTHFEEYSGEGYAKGDMIDDDVGHFCNGPKLLLKYVNLKFRITGYLHATRVRIDIVRHKRMVHAYWKDEQNRQLLPYCLPTFKNICGFTPNSISRKDMEILATKHIWMNSRETSSFTDAAQGEEETAPATTSGVRHCNIYLPLNKVLKQLDTNTDELTAVEGSVDTGSNAFGSGGGYQYNNLHPLANIWAIVSTDAVTNFQGLIDQEHNVGVEVVRTCVWRDPRE